MSDLKEQLGKSIKNNSQTTMWEVFDALLDDYKKTYQKPVEQLERRSEKPL